MKKSRKYINNQELSVIGVPIFGHVEKGRSKSHSYLIFLQDGKRIIIAVSKNPDRRIKELKMEYGNQIKHILSRRTFSAYDDKKKLQDYFKECKIGNNDIYEITMKDVENAIKKLKLKSMVVFIEE